MKTFKPFAKQYKEIKNIVLVLTILGITFIIIGATSEWINILNPLVLTLGSIYLFYAIMLFFLYQKCANYQKKQQPLPKWFRIISSILLIFYLALFQLEDDTKKYRQYILLKEIRFYVFLWIFLCLLVYLLSIPALQKNNFLWFAIGLGIINIIWIIDVILTICIWKYNGSESKTLKILSIVTLNYRNYKLYQTITNLNSNEKST